MSRVLLLTTVAVMLLPSGCSKPVERIRLNRENARLAKIVGPYFSGYEGATNFIDMSKEEKLATINSLRDKVQSGSKLLFLEIDDSGEFISIDRPEGIDAQLASCALTTNEIAQIKNAARAGAIVGRPESDRWTPPRADGRREPPQGRGSSLSSGHVLNSSQYDVWCVAHGILENREGRDLYRGACCLILSPTSLR